MPSALFYAQLEIKLLSGGYCSFACHTSITFHTARNSFYVIGKRAGMDDRAISEILGHSTITTTEKYKRIEDSYIREQMGKLNLQFN